MKESRWLYFAFGVTAVLSIGAVSGVSISDVGIIFPDGTVQTTAANLVDPRRAFYLTSLKYEGGDADGSDGDGAGVCAAGFHFASIWEIYDVSSLRYATDAEGNSDVLRKADSGHGPPVGTVGWARTGWEALEANGAASCEDYEGRANCSAWSTSNGSSCGTAYELEEVVNAETGLGEPTVMIAPWDAAHNRCSSNRGVWCVEDYPGSGSVLQ